MRLEGIPTLEELEAAVQRCPADAAAWRRLACSIHTMAAVDYRTALLKHLLRLAPDDAQAHQQLGMQLVSEGRCQEAIAHMHEAARLDQENPGLSAYYLGYASHRAGDLDAAIRHFRNAVELDPGFVLALQKLAQVLCANERPKEAIPVLERALVGRFQSAPLWDQLGEAHASAGDHHRAVQAYRLSLRFNATRAAVHYRLGVSFAWLGQLDEARAAFEESVRLDPMQDDAILFLLEIAIQQRPKRRLP